ncbi:hypothetical protein B0H12DRAFT_1234953 [Mycena haematopus]|nr:hypothetical protein B0H12DRAFT_1234953 [Mycena haematopus]
MRKKEFKLNDRELGTLPEEHRTSDTSGYLMQLYSGRQVEDLALRKCAKLGVNINSLVYYIFRIRNPGKKFAQTSGLDGAHQESSTASLKIAKYTRPPNPVKPDPKLITWKPSKLSGPVSVEDACRLYCIEPTDIQDLSARSLWIDLATVAKRAVTLHGGFYAHQNLVFQRREAEQKTLSESNPYADWESLFQFFPMSQAELNRDRAYDWMYDSSQPSPPNRVAVFYPIEYVCFDKYGSDCEWMPRWGEF